MPWSKPTSFSIRPLVKPATAKPNFAIHQIINLSSGIRDTSNLAPYSVSKAAVDKYTRDLAAELKDSNVLVNCLDPGWLKTDMGGPDAMYPVENVLPGALVPALLDDDGPTGQCFAAQDYRMLDK